MLPFVRDAVGANRRGEDRSARIANRYCELPRAFCAVIKQQRHGVKRHAASPVARSNRLACASVAPGVAVPGDADSHALARTTPALPARAQRRAHKCGI